MRGALLAALLGLLPVAATGETLTARSGWTVRAAPVFTGPLSVVGDPSVIRTPQGFAMYHHCLDVMREPQGGEVCLALSGDGVTWTSPETALGSRYVPGQLLAPGDWDQAHETPFAVPVAGEVWLYVLGYQGVGFRADPKSAAIGWARSTDGVTFSPLVPLVTPSVPQDAAGMTSPSAIADSEGGVILYYSGWGCPDDLARCMDGTAPWGLSLLAVRQGSDGRLSGPPRVVVGDPGLTWAPGGIAEAEVIRAPDGRIHLFFTTLTGPRGTELAVQRIGRAVARDPFGPFVFAPEPILTPADLPGTWAGGGVLAPSVVIGGGKIRLWFHGFEVDGSGAITAGRIGLAEHPWPLD